MAPRPLDILKKGLAKFTTSIKARKDVLTTKLAKKEPIPPSDEEWLDNEANVIDEERVLEALEAASDYERGVAKLDDTGKPIVQKLREWAGDLSYGIL